MRKLLILAAILASHITIARSPIYYNPLTGEAVGDVKGVGYSFPVGTRIGAVVLDPTKTNTSATSDPTPSDDINSDYEIGSVWDNVITSTVWRCLDSSAGAAIWKAFLFDGEPVSAATEAAIEAAIDLADIQGSVVDGQVPSTLTRDTEWDTTTKINTATTDEDFLVDSDIQVTVQAYDEDLDDLADGVLSGTKVSDADDDGVTKGVSAFNNTHFDAVSGVVSIASVAGVPGSTDDDVSTADVETAGAVMDTEVDANIKTLIIPPATTISTFGATLVDDLNQAAALSTLGADPAGTDNSTDVTLGGSLDYITIVDQEITPNAIDLATDTTGNLGTGSLAGGSGATSGTFWRGDGTWATPVGTGDVSTIGIPLDGQIGVWTGDGTLEGDVAFTFDTTTDTLGIGASGNLSFGGVVALDDTAGSLALQNIDSVDATTEITIEAAIDSLVNLTSVGIITTGTWQGTPIADAYIAGAAGWDAKGTGDGDALVGNPLSQFAATTSAELAGVVSNETGTGALVLGTSPVLVTPALGTPSAVVLTNATGYPGDTSLVTAGTLGTGTWQGTPVADAYIAGAAGWDAKQSQADILDDIGAVSAPVSDNSVLVSTGAGTFALESGATLLASVGADPAGTDNSTDVTLGGSLDYITIVDQEITPNAIDLATDTTGNLGTGSLAGGSGATSGTFWRGDGTWATPSGAGDVSKVDTPLNNQIGVWTGNGTLEGDVAFTFDTTTDTLGIGASGNLSFGGVVALDDAAGSMTLKNIDSIDATTEITIEAAIDSLVNLTSTGTITTGTWQGTPIADAYIAGASGWDAKGDALVANPLSQFAATTSLQLSGVVSDETGTGAVVFGTSPTLVTPALGTPSSAVLTNATGYPGDTSLVTVGTLGTGTWQGTPIADAYISGAAGWDAKGDALVGNTLSQFAATTSAELAGVISNETGTGAVVFGTSPTLVTPALGTPSAAVLTNATGYPGDTSLVTVGTLGTGTWQGTPIADAYIAGAAGWDAKGDALTTNSLSQFAATTSLQLAGVLSQ